MKMKTLLVCAFKVLPLSLLSHSVAAQYANYFAGTGAGLSNTTGNRNTFVGFYAGYLNTTGTLNTALGAFAGGGNKATSFNTSIGAYAGFLTNSSSTLGENVYVGYRSGYSNINGVYNTFVGSNAGYANLGSYNVFLGNYAGNANTTGLSNTFTGWAAGSSNTTANSNSFYGNLAGHETTTGSKNSFFGSGTGYQNKDGSNNSFFGSRAGYQNTASANTFIGTSAGESNTSGYSNSFLGYSAGINNSTGSGNIFMGTDAGHDNTTGSSNSFIGFSAGGKNSVADNNSFMGFLAGYSTTTGGNNTFMGHNSGRNNSSGYRNSFLGTNAGNNTTTGSQNTFMGYDAGTNNAGGTANTALGYAAGTSTSSLTNATALGNRARVNTSNALVLGSINGVNGATATVNVGIGTASPGYRLHVNGNAAKPGGGSWTAASDQRLKQNINDFMEGMKILTQIHPVTYQYNGKAGLPTDKQFVGVIAQEMQKIAPYTVGTFTYQDSTGQSEQYLDYDATALTYILVNSVKEQQQEIDSLKNELTQIKHLLHRLSPGSPIPTSAFPSGASLSQNQPNPYGESTTISYFVPESVTSAQVKFYSTTGQEIHSINLTKKGAGEIKLDNKQFASGTYIYHLFINGKGVASKKLMLVR